jgi:hypothetical protein
VAKKAIDDKDKEKALKKLLGETVSSAGKIDADERPTKIKDRVVRQAKGDLDAEGYAKETQRRGKKR